jgi:2,3-bisphosphoglycerate-independent phosphoglycerate mutase
VVAITADHGNAEEMVDPTTGEPKTAHTENPVPFILIGAPPGTTLAPKGILASVSPTLLTLMNLPVPDTMTAPSLLEPEQ